MATHVVQFPSKEEYTRAIPVLSEVPWTRVGLPNLKMVLFEDHVRALDRAGIHYTDITRYIPRDPPAPVQP